MASEETKADEAGKVNILTGFGSLAHIISSDADHSTEVYKRFGKLAARDLLYYEAELLELEELQEQFDREDALDAGKLNNVNLELWHKVRKNARHWQSFKESAQHGSPEDRWKKRMDLAMQIRTTLKEYRKPLTLVWLTFH